MLALTVNALMVHGPVMGSVDSGMLPELTEK
jgi:hypothetical protein